MPTHWYGILTAVVSAGVQFVLFLRWLHRRMRDDEIVRAFVREHRHESSTAHLHRVVRNRQAAGIDLPETPMCASWIERLPAPS